MLTLQTTKIYDIQIACLVVATRFKKGLSQEERQWYNFGPSTFSIRSCFQVPSRGKSHLVFHRSYLLMVLRLEYVDVLPQCNEMFPYWWMNNEYAKNVDMSDTSNGSMSVREWKYHNFRNGSKLICR